MLKHVDVIPFLKQYLNGCYAGYFPEFWSESIIVPIHKKWDAESPGNYRGVSLLSVVSKIFTYDLNKRLTGWIKDGNKVSKEQAGFRAGYSEYRIFIVYE